MTATELQALDTEIERRNFELSQELFSELIKAKLSRLQVYNKVAKSATDLQKKQH